MASTTNAGMPAPAPPPTPAALGSSWDRTLPTPVRLGGEEAGLGHPACEHLNEGHGGGGGDSQAAQFILPGQAAAASEAGVEGGGEGDGPTALAFGAAAEEQQQRTTSNGGRDLSYEGAANPMSPREMVGEEGGEEEEVGAAIGTSGGG